jgi:hypothetical protein
MCRGSAADCPTRLRAPASTRRAHVCGARFARVSCLPVARVTGSSVAADSAARVVHHCGDGRSCTGLEVEMPDWRAVCGRTACTVRREGRAGALPYPYQKTWHPRGLASVTTQCGGPERSSSKCHWGLTLMALT